MNYIHDTRIKSNVLIVCYVATVELRYKFNCTQNGVEMTVKQRGTALTVI